MEYELEDVTLGIKNEEQLPLDELARIQVAKIFHSRWSTYCYNDAIGVKNDRQPTFSRHAAPGDCSLCQLAGALHRQASTSWGHDRQTFRAANIATGLSKVEYGASSWLPLISQSTLVK